MLLKWMHSRNLQACVFDCFLQKLRRQLRDPPNVLVVHRRDDLRHHHLLRTLGAQGAQVESKGRNDALQGFSEQPRLLMVQSRGLLHTRDRPQVHQD